VPKASEHWERIEAAIAGESVDHPPVSLWRHFPEEDQDAATLARVTLAWQRRFAFDFVKLMPPGDYPVIAWGGASEYRGSPSGTRTVTRYPVEQPADWPTIRPLPVDLGPFRTVNETARLVARELGGAVPVLQTVFSPLTVAYKLSAGRVLHDLVEHPALVEEALAAITETMRALVHAALAAGADGLFFATQCATADLTDPATYARWGRPGDLAVLEAAAGAGPSLAEGEQRSGRCVAGGLDETAIATLAPEAVAAQARDAIAQLKGRHLMVTPGCVIPIATPDANVAAAVAAVRSNGERSQRS